MKRNSLNCRYNDVFENIGFIAEEDDSPTSILLDVSDNILNETSNIDASGNIIKKDNQITYKKYTYKQVETKIKTDYFDEKEYHSSALDILATYLRGQKLI